MENLCALAQAPRDEEEEGVLSAHARNSEMIMRILKNLEEGMEKLPLSNELFPVAQLFKFLQDAGVSFFDNIVFKF